MMHAESVTIASADYDKAIRVALVQQVPASILCLLMLDGGYAAKVCGCAMLGFWIGTGWLLARRPFNPSPTDLRFVRWGFLPLFAVSMAFAATWCR